ncbi:unnamed protein product [Kuraishia capsulata CBS 1993]|uniref:Squalene synthase n=1 Tax=Kuraishia capsulata CBS 1993 TaxID=1382522 RepID=W6MXC6_9ASCO|nr:uncharacterized protein KUCA_T00004639001 [Kuraishia capsulata CBS 1993]CDK28655.1 unnamed protein product [Kuraishia capsulata CBS 1993]
MGKVTQLLSHPSELVAAVQLKPLFQRDEASETANEKRCYELLKLTSRSFVAVILELNPELRQVITVFYLVLRALDTVEDDMTLSPEVKIPLLREFDSKLNTKDWTFTGSGPNEKDREVLVDFDEILTQYHLLKPVYQDVIKDITHKMGNGMADYIVDEQFNLNGLETIKDYDLYCHYVAGLVGEGLTKLTTAAGFSDKKLLDKMELSESMGLFLQKTNIIRDYKEDLDDGRSFWPKEVWSRYRPALSDFEKPEYLEDGLHCISDLVLNALEHVKDCLLYLSLVYDRSSYNFCVIPQVMAIATLHEVFNNPEVFKTNVKIRKGTTVKLILDSRTFEGTCKIFSDYVRKIHHKCPVSDPNYLKIGMKCGEIEQFIEELFPEKNLPSGVKPQQTEAYTSALYRRSLDKDVHSEIAAEAAKVRFVLGLITATLAYGLYSVFF